MKTINLRLTDAQAKKIEEACELMKWRAEAEHGLSRLSRGNILSLIAQEYIALVEEDV